MYDKIEIIKLDKLGLKRDSSIFYEEITDEQVGNIGCREDKIAKRSKYIRNTPNRFTLFGGDQIDAISPLDRRFNRETEVEFDFDQQRAKWQKLHQALFEVHKKQTIKSTWISSPEENYKHEGINEKVWGLLWGNHEYKIPYLTKSLIDNQFCKQNQLHFLGAKCMIGLRVMWKNEILHEWSLAIMHGSGGGTVENMFKGMKQNWEADAYFCSHLHQKKIQPEIVYAFDWRTGRVYQKDIILVNTGSFQEPITNDVDGYMDRKNSIIATGVGTSTVEYNGYDGSMKGHL